MSKKIKYLFECYLTKKIGVEIKCCLMFFLILCFYCIYRWITNFNQASILHMLEMVLLAYLIGWIQNLLHYDFDEVDALRLREWVSVILSSLVYAVAGHFGGWFEGNIVVCICFGLYMVCAYLCSYLIYKIKRTIDAKHLNEDLQRFQNRLKDEA